LRIPLLPLAEQKIVAAKVGHLLAICDMLENHLRQVGERATKLAAAVANELVSSEPAGRVAS